MADNLPAVSARDLATMPFEAAIEHYSPQFAAELPSHIPLERFKRTVMTAVNQNPDLFYADRRTLFTACVKCAHDGLYPDGREAALVVYKTTIKRGTEKVTIDAVQYLPMIAGIRKRMRNSGDVLSAEAHVVYKNDHFHHRQGDSPSIEHEPPPLGEPRGKPIGAYAIIRLKNSGEPIREVMSVEDITKARNVSRAKDGPGWTNWWEEMARKTVLRRASKAAPTSSDDMDLLLNRDDEMPALPAAEDMPALPPRPRREDFTDDEPAQPMSAEAVRGEDDTPASDPAPLDSPTEGQAAPIPEGAPLTADNATAPVNAGADPPDDGFWGLDRLAIMEANDKVFLATFAARCDSCPDIGMLDKLISHNTMRIGVLSRGDKDRLHASADNARVRLE